jgi:hypothetical protein
LDLSVKTVEAHQENIKRKLQLSSCAELRERAANWIERSFRAEAHLFRGIPEGRKNKVLSLSVL